MEDFRPLNWLTLLGAFAIVVAPIVLVMRMLGRLARQAYGFEDVDDSGPPLRICARCHNTVLEDDYTHCPYCGRQLPSMPPEPEAASETPRAGVDHE